MTDAEAEQCRFCREQSIVTDGQRGNTAARSVNGQCRIGKT